MAVAHSAASESHTGTAGSISQASFNWTHTQTGTPQGVLVFVHVVNSSANPVSSVTYGSVTLTRVTGGAAIDAAGEPGRTDLFFAGSGLASGNQTITVNRSNTVDEMYASAATVTAATGTILNGIVLLEGDGTMDEQSVDDGTSGTNSVRYAAAYSGLNAPPTAGANSTLLTSIDFGTYTAAMVRETTAGQGARLVGFSTASDDRAAVHVAVRERVYQITGERGSFTLTGNAANTRHNVRTTGDTGKFFLPERNQQRWTEEFNNAAWGKANASITANATTAPDGTLTADALIENTTPSVGHNATQSITYVTGKTYTRSCYFKLYPGPITRYARLQLGAAVVFGGDTYININLTTGTIAATNGAGATSAITNEGNGWYRASITRQYTGSGITSFPAISIISTTGTSLYTDADGLSGIYIWGVQFEEAAAVTDYDPTGPAGATDATLRQAYRLDGGRGAFTFIGNAASTLYNVRTTGDTGKFFLPERNLFRWSEQFNNAAWGKSNTTVSADVTSAPDGTLTADKLIENTANALHLINQFSPVAGVNYVFSIFAKAAERTKIAFAGGNFNGQGFFVVFNLSTGTLDTNTGGKGTIVDYANGWYRCSIAWTAGSSSPLLVNLVDATGAGTYTGDGVSGAYLWGAQVEIGTSITDYDPTGPAGATDAALRQAYRLDGGTGTFTLTGQPITIINAGAKKRYILIT